MSTLIRVGMIGLACVLLAVGATAAVLWAVDDSAHARPRRVEPAPRERPVAEAEPQAEEPPLDAGIDRPLEDGGVSLANHFTGPLGDGHALSSLREAVRARGPLAEALMRSRLDLLHLDEFSSPDQRAQGVRLRNSLALLALYDGRLEDADAGFAEAFRAAEAANLPQALRCDLLLLRGIVALRRGERDNCVACVGPSSCIFPIAREAMHLRPSGSREALALFAACLERRPDDLRARWLLNLAYMTLGEYPEKVPARFLVPLDSFRSTQDIGRFANVATEAGLNARGPNLAGGSIFDDFTGDGRPDLFTTSLDVDRGASLFVNNGDGTFTDRSAAAGLGDQVYALNLARADYDNDGDLDVLLLRGGWERPMRPSLLRNRGDGTFEDVTLAAGMGTPIACESASWGDFDNDGLADVFLCGEYLRPSGEADPAGPDPRNRSRLYRNRGDGTFEDVAARAGVENLRCAKGSAWGDYDADGRIDLYVSNMNGPSRLYHNQGDGTFRDVAPELGVTGADVSFAVWFWDYDNDGRPDIYVNENLSSTAEIVAVALGKPVARTSRPRLYRNLGPEGFRDVAREVGLDRPMTPMGCNFGDVDDDGYLDLFLGTGGMSYEDLVPDLLFKNAAGARFEDVTVSSGTGHLQKGHGVSFADYDGDGDLDFFVENGGAAPGDPSHNALFRNPGHGRHWLDVKLVGTRTNRSALGAKLRAVVVGPDGTPRAIHRTIGDNSSFGGNRLVEHLGLSDATRVDLLEITWPVGPSTQTFRNLAADRAIVITEGSDHVGP